MGLGKFGLTRRLIVVSCLMLISLVVVACGSDEPTPTPTQAQQGGEATATPTPAGMGGVDENGVVVPMEGESEEDYLARLYEAAQEEGSVHYYHSANQEEIEAIINGWNSVFPEVEFVETQATNTTILERTLTECRAGRVQADIYGGASGDQAALDDAGCIEEYRPVRESKIDPAFVFEGEPYVAIGYLTFHVAYNSELLDDSQVPSDWEGYLDPMFADQMAANIGGFEWYCGVKQGMGAEEGRAFLEQLADQNVRLVEGGTLRAELLSAGEFTTDLTFYGHTLARYQGLGFPIEIKVPHPDPLPAVVDMSSVQKNSPNPNGARLVQEFFLMPEGQQVFLGQGKAGVLVEGVEHPYGDLLEGANIIAMGPKDVDFATCEAEWDELFVRRR